MRYAPATKFKTSCPVKGKKGIVVDGARTISVRQGARPADCGGIGVDRIGFIAVSLDELGQQSAA